RSGALCSEPGQSIRRCVSAAHGDLALDLGTDLRALRCATTAN
ncbi:hypothetical protein V2A05_34010, partial [Pseudomonas aeruginosa]